MEVGRVCVKLAGREAKQTCVIVDNVDESFVLVSGPYIRRRRCNVKHIEPLKQKLSLKKGATDSEVTDALVKAGLVEKPKEKPKKVKAEEKPAKKEEKPEKAEKKKLFKKPAKKTKK
jgi:large subunit ribosomal protein L14e